MGFNEYGYKTFEEKVASGLNIYILLLAIIP